MTAYIWDLDGTLLDSYGMIVEAASRTAADEGINDPKDYILKVVKQKSCTAYMEEISNQCGKTVREVFAQYQKHTHALDDRIELIDGAKETLERLQAKLDEKDAQLAKLMGRLDEKDAELDLLRAEM